MSVEADLFQTLRGQVADRMYPLVAPQGVARPYITYQQVGGTPHNFIESALPSKRNARFRIRYWHDKGKAMDVLALAREGERLLVESTALRAFVETGLASISEPDTGLIGTWQDFSVWFDT